MTTTSKRIIGSDKTNQCAIDLFNDIKNFTNDYGQVWLVETIRSGDLGNNWREVHWRPFAGSGMQPQVKLDRNILRTMYDLADEYNCEVRFIVRDEHIQLVFFDDGKGDS